MADSVREEMEDIIKLHAMTPKKDRAGRTTTDFLRVIKGHTEHRGLLVGYVERCDEHKRVVQKRRVCDIELTKTLESLPEEVKSD